GVALLANGDDGVLAFPITFLAADTQLAPGGDDAARHVEPAGQRTHGHLVAPHQIAQFLAGHDGPLSFSPNTVPRGPSAPGLRPDQRTPGNAGCWPECLRPASGLVPESRADPPVRGGRQGSY